MPVNFGRPLNMTAEQWDAHKAQCEANEAAARQRAEQRRQDEQRQQAQRLEAQRVAQANAAKEQFKQRARSTFPGSAAEFERVWPDILRQWQLQQVAQAEGRAGATLDQKRRAYGDML